MHRASALPHTPESGRKREQGRSNPLPFPLERNPMVDREPRGHPHKAEETGVAHQRGSCRPGSEYLIQHHTAKKTWDSPGPTAPPHTSVLHPGGWGGVASAFSGFRLWLIVKAPLCCTIRRECLSPSLCLANTYRPGPGRYSSWSETLLRS